MPPRLQPQRLPQPSACQCLRSRPQAVAEPHVFSRSFHKSPAALERNKEAGKAPVRRKTLLRRDMDAWLAGPGFRFRRSSPGSTNYLSAYDKEGNLRRWPEREEATQRARETEDAREAEVVKQEEAEGVDEAERASRAAVRAEARAKRIAEARIPPKERLSDLYPFPLNQAFKSEAVLSEELREELYRQVVVRKMDLQGVSAAYGVDMRRVAAVIRLKTIEKQWIEEGKQLAAPYNEAVLAMLPTTPLRQDGSNMVAHESINDLPVHPATRQQLFYPTSESRNFTREDAAKAFSPSLLPADKRIPHPQLVQLERWNAEDVSRTERLNRFAEIEEKEHAAAVEKERKQKEWEARTQRTVQGRRWDFKFQDISAENVGKDGRSSKGVGHRYGMPHTERKRGEVKIPTSVE